DRKSTRLNSSHGYISYAVFCLKKKKQRFPETVSGGFPGGLRLRRGAPRERSPALRSRRPGAFFFFNDTATTEIYTLSLHDALPISPCGPCCWPLVVSAGSSARSPAWRDRKSTRLNSSHGYISYAVFCLKKKTL